MSIFFYIGRGVNQIHHNKSVEFEIAIHTFLGEVWFLNPNSTRAALSWNLDLKTTLHLEKYGWSSQIPHFHQWCIWLTPRHSDQWEFSICMLNSDWSIYSGFSQIKIQIPHLRKQVWNLNPNSTLEKASVEFGFQIPHLRKQVWNLDSKFHTCSNFKLWSVEFGNILPVEFELRSGVKTVKPPDIPNVLVVFG